MVAFVLRKVIIYPVLAALCVPVWAGLPVRNHNPFAQFVGVPALQSARIMAAGQQQLALDATISNQFVLETDEHDPLLVDVESHIGDFTWRRGFDGWEASVVLPYVSYQRGFLDSFVVGWHKAFNLPNGNRSSMPREQLQIAYAGADSFLLDGPAQGIGDVRIQAGRQWGGNAAVYASLKLPTGDERRGLGSGGTDLALFSAWGWRQANWQQELQLGLVLMEQPEVLANLRREVAVFGSAALGYRLNEQLSLFVQYDAHSPFYQSTEQPALGAAHMFSAGWRVACPGWSWHFALVEDIGVDTAPDVGFQLGVTANVRE